MHVPSLAIGFSWGN